jgi:hypothetical protein
MDASADQQLAIRDNLSRVKENITRTAQLAGRNPDEIRLVVVAKKKSTNLIKNAIEAGAVDLGENYVEEGLEKIRSLTAYPGIRWHMIGHLQSRKAQECAKNFEYLHSLDSLKLADRLNRFCVEINKTLPVWLEFNVSGEVSKSGWDIRQVDDWNEILPDIEHILALPNLRVLGAMTMPPYSENPEDSRSYYQTLRKFQAYVIKHFQLTGFTELSIGMSSDYEVAIQEGSTCVRIGQAILGPRAG